MYPGVHLASGPLLFSAPDYLPVPLLLFKLVEHALDSELCACWSLCLEYPHPPPQIFTEFPLPLPLQPVIKCPLFREALLWVHLKSSTSLPSPLRLPPCFLSCGIYLHLETLSFFLCFNMKRFLSFSLLLASSQSS